MGIQSRDPQDPIRWPNGVHCILTDDLVLGFLNRHQLPKFGWLDHLAFSDRLGMRFEEAQNLIRNVCVATKDPKAGLFDHPSYKRNR
jgi:hypothetical protein